MYTLRIVTNKWNESQSAFEVEEIQNYNLGEFYSKVYPPKEGEFNGFKKEELDCIITSERRAPTPICNYHFWCRQYPVPDEMKNKPELKCVRFEEVFIVNEKGTTLEKI